MNLLDIIFTLFMLWFVFRGFSRGFIMSIASLVALIAGIYFSVYFSSLVGSWLSTSLHWQSKYMPVISFAITFFIVVVVIQIIGRIFHKIADWAALGFLNRLAGALLGTIKGILFLGVILFIINTFDINKKLMSEELRSGSRLYSPMSKVFPYIWPKIKSTYSGEKKQTPPDEVII